MLCQDGRGGLCLFRGLGLDDGLLLGAKLGREGDRVNSGVGCHEEFFNQFLARLGIGGVTVVGAEELGG